MSHAYGRADRAPRTNNWQDWANLALAVWLFVSPWVLRFGAGEPEAANVAVAAVDPATGAANAAWNASLLGAIVAAVSVSAIARMEFWQERLNVVLAIWIFVAPWVLGFTPLRLASWDHWVVGVLVFVISMSLLTRRTPPRDASAPGRRARPERSANRRGRRAA